MSIITSKGASGNVSITGPQEVIITHEDDSIRIGNGSSLVTATNDLGKVGLDVNVINQLNGAFTQAPAGATVSAFNTQSVAIGATEIVTSYTVPLAADMYLQKIYFSGTQVVTAEIKVNGITKYKFRLSPTQFSFTVDIATGSAFGIRLFPSDVINVTATNESNAIAVYDATIQLLEAI